MNILEEDSYHAPAIIFLGVTNIPPEYLEKYKPE